MRIERLNSLLATSSSMLKTAGASTRRARLCISQSRELLSRSGDRVIHSAASVTAARWSAR